TKVRGKGTGLGLASVRGTVEQHGGSIYVDSEPGHGTSIEILLPRTEPSEQTPAQRRQTPIEVVGGHEKVLVVEDDSSVRTLISDVLTNLGYAVLLADGLAQAEAFACSEPIDLLLSDVLMPGADGPSV